MTLAADQVLQRLRDWGIERIYGDPGDGINGLLGAFDRAKGQPELIQTRHEEMTAFMASAHAEFTGEAGCCTAQLFADLSEFCQMIVHPGQVRHVIDRA